MTNAGSFAPQYSTAQKLGLGTPHMCWTTSWTNHRTVGSDFNHTKRKLATLNIDFFAKYDEAGGESRTVRTYHLTGSEYTLCNWEWVEENPHAPPHWKYRCNAPISWDEDWDGGLKAAFQNGATAGAPDAALAAEVLGDNRRWLDETQRALQAHLLADAQVKAGAKEASGAKALIRSAATLAFPSTLRRHELFHSLLYGNQSLLDTQSVTAGFAPPVTEAGELDGDMWERTQRDVDLLKQFKDASSARLPKLRKVVGDWQDLAAAGKLVNAPQVIEETLEQLELAKLVAYGQHKEGGVPRHALTVSRAGDGNGTVTAAGVACGADCDELYDVGTVVVLTATPAAGSTFSGWGGGCSGSGATCVVTMSSGKSATAVFTSSPPPPPPPSASLRLRCSLRRRNQRRSQSRSPGRSRSRRRRPRRRRSATRARRSRCPRAP